MNSGSLHTPSNPATSDPDLAEIAADPASHFAVTQRLAKSALKYLEGRGILLGIEAREALHYAATVGAWLAIGVMALFSAWLLMATSLVGVLTLYLDWSLMTTTAIVGVAHLVLALISAFVVWKRLTTVRWFADSLNELKKDRIWLKGQTTKK